VFYPSEECPLPPAAAAAPFQAPAAANPLAHDPWLAEATAWIKANGVPNTVKAYGVYGRQFEAFCLLHNRAFFPAAPSTVALFMKSLQERGLAIATINGVALSAINSSYKLSEFVSPTASSLVREAKCVISRTAKPAGKGKLPLTAVMLLAIVAVAKQSLIDIRDIFMVILMMAAFLRESEVVAIRISEIWLELIDGVEVLFVLVFKSKTDHVRNGHTIVIAAATANPSICPLAWYKRWLAARNKDALYLFHNSCNSAQLSPSTPCGRVKLLLERINIDPAPYGSHSCRKGGCTAAARAGINIRLLMRHGNWKSEAVYLYIRDTLQDRLSVSAAVFK
jgi:site-specific recombinase XerD